MLRIAPTSLHFDIVLLADDYWLQACFAKMTARGVQEESYGQKV
jgi:hypothetical protein